MSLQIENPYKISENAFVITVNGQEYEYEIPEDKDVDQVVERIEQWLERGEDAWGGLYDWIKASFKMVGEYEQPIEEDDGENIEDPLLSSEEEPLTVDIPSDVNDVNEIIDEGKALELEFKIEEDNVNISIDDWSADFEIIDTTEDFTDILHERVKEEMTLRDRTLLIVDLMRGLDTEDEVNYYNLINLLLNTDIEIVDSFEKAEEENVEPSIEPEPVIEPTNVEEQPSEDKFDYEPVEGLADSETLTIKGSYKKALVEDGLWDGTQTGPETIQDIDVEDAVEEEKLELEDLVINKSFIDDLISLELSLYAITSQDKKKTIYFIGGINERGSKYSLSYSNSEPIEIPDTFEECDKMEVCLNNIEDLNTVVDYIDKLLGIVYNQEIKKVHKNIGGEDE